MRKLLHIVGNRPHFIKLAMLHQQLATEPTIEQKIIHTGQHSSEEMSGVFFKELGIPEPDYNLKIDNNGGADVFIAYTSTALQKLFSEFPDAIIFTYGDTNSTLAAAIAAKRSGLELHHFEGGIRTADYTMPEEINRVITDRLANVNYCCTQYNLNTLTKEGHGTAIPNKIFFTGDLMYDAFLKTEGEPLHDIPESGYVACTIHRLANIAEPSNLKNIIAALNDINKEIPVILPLHPHTQKRMSEYHIHPDFKIIPPLGYRQMKHFLQHCDSIITDSGGVSREAYFAGKRSLVITPTLFWPEIAEEGCAINSLPIKEQLIDNFGRLSKLSANFSNQIFGNGNATEKIVKILTNTDVA